MGRVKSPKGPPAGVGTDKAGIKEVGVESLHIEEEIVEKYTEGADEHPASTIKVRHKNRNLDKPQIDKPAYS